MSHFSGHIQPGCQVPQARVAFFGMSVVAVGLFGFYAHLQKRHERKHVFDRANEDRARISSWEHRLLQRNTPPSSDSPNVLRASRIETRSSPLPPPTTEHNSRHRTIAEDNGNAIPASTDSNSSTSAAFLSSSPSDTSTSTLGPLMSDNNGRPTAYAQPTAQKGHPDGRPGVYTKNPGWREAAHYATGGKTPTMGPGDGIIDREAQTIRKLVETVEEKVKSVFGK